MDNNGKTTTKTNGLTGLVKRGIAFVSESTRQLRRGDSQKDNAPAKSKSSLNLFKKNSSQKLNHELSVQRVVPANTVTNSNIETAIEQKPVSNYAKTKPTIEDVLIKVKDSYTTSAELTAVDLTGKIGVRKEIGNGHFGIVQRIDLNDDVPELFEYCTRVPKTVEGRGTVLQDRTCLKLLKDESKSETLITEGNVGEYLDKNLKAKGITNSHCNKIKLAYELVEVNGQLVKSYRIISSYACHGSLPAYIHSTRLSTEAEKVSKVKIWMKQAITGLKNMHDVNVVHGDLALRNFLLGSNGIEIADYGLAGVLESDDGRIPDSSGIVPIRWATKERLRNDGISKYSDVFAMKIALLEMIADIAGMTPTPEDPNATKPALPSITFPELNHTAMVDWIVTNGNAAYLNQMYNKVHSYLKYNNKTEMLHLLTSYKECLTLKDEHDKTYNADNLMSDYEVAEKNAHRPKSSVAQLITQFEQANIVPAPVSNYAKSVEHRNVTPKSDYAKTACNQFKPHVKVGKQAPNFFGNVKIVSPKRELAPRVQIKASGIDGPISKGPSMKANNGI